jgi:AAA family ATP:ADP antiporter
LLRAHVEIGVAFYLWVGVFNYTAIAQLWSFANDIYTPEQGQRLFAILGSGSSVGAVAGAFAATRLANLGPEAMLIGASAILLCVVLLVAVVDRREAAPRQADAAKQEEPPLEGPVLQRLLRDKYLLWIALLMLLVNCVNSTGEYLLDRTLLGALSHGHETAHEAMRDVAQFKADYFGWVNIAGVVLQLFAVSRILRVLGVRRTLFVLPLVATLSYGCMLATPVLALIRVGKIAENSLDYSVQNTARQALFLVGKRAEKYLGKTVIDTFMVRAGDVLSAVLVFGGNALDLPIGAFALLNLGMIACWLLVLVGLGREHTRREATLALAGPVRSGA